MVGAGSPLPRPGHAGQMMKPLVLVALAVSLLAGGLPAADDPVDDPAGGQPAAATWRVRPTDLDGQARAAYEWNLDPGASASDTVVITNLGAEPLSLALSAADIVTTPSGDVTLADDDADPLAREWVALAAQEVTLRPQETVEVPFDIAPPANAEPGDYAVAVLASVARPVSGDQGQAAMLDVRVGARLYLRVIGDLRSELAISDLTVERDAEWWNPLPAPTTSDFVVTNEGNVRLDASAVVTLTGPFGWELGRTEVRELPQLLPGDSVRLSQAGAGDGAGSGPVVVADVIAPFLLTTTVEINATEVSTGQGFVYTASTSTTEVPWLAVGVVVLIILTVLGRVVARRRRRRRAATAGTRTGPPTATEEPEDARATAPSDTSRGA